MLTLLCNTAANELLLAAPCDADIGPWTDEIVRANFIMRKYQKLEWANKDKSPDPFDAIQTSDYFAFFHALNLGRADDKFKTLTPLHAAVQSGDPLMVAIATCCAHDVDALDGNGWTPLVYALFYGENDIARFLLSFGSKPEKGEIDVGTLALYNGDKELLETVLLSAGKREANASIFRPICTKFAAGKNAAITEILVPVGTKRFYKMYRDAPLH
jgi:hypothetical protein